MKYLISLFKSLFCKKPLYIGHQAGHNIHPSFVNTGVNTLIGKSLDDTIHTTGNDSTQLGVNDPNYTGFFFETTLPDGSIVKTRDRIHIGYKKD